MFRNLKLIGSIVLGVLLLSTTPSWAERTPSSPVVKDVPVFIIPTDTAERLELIGYSQSQPLGQGIDLNSRVFPVVIQPSSTKFHVLGENCWIKDGVLNANEPAVCRVIAARAGNPFSPITVLSTPTLFYFGTISAGTSNTSLPLPILNVPIPTLDLSGEPPVEGEITLRTDHPDIPVTYYEVNGNASCVVTGDRLTKATSGTCRIRAIKAQIDSYPFQFSQIVEFTF
jgi:hypothetical protein